MDPMYSVVVPVYNEEPALGETYARLAGVMDNIFGRYEIIFVNDGSSDGSRKIIEGFIAYDARIRLINFSRNFGHQPAITAGMDYSRGDAVVIIDADLQDPPEVIPAMIEKWKNGFEVVYGKRTARKGENFFKKATANFYYRLLRSMTSVDIPVDAGDFRLIDRKVADAMKRLNEKNRYVRGLVSWAGFKQTYVEYTRDERFAGETKYPLKKMLALAMNGVASFSYKPLKLATFGGIFFMSAGFIYLIAAVFKKIIHASLHVWTPPMIMLLLTQGFVLITLGLIGEYIGRIYDEAKNRPIYIVADVVGGDGNDECEPERSAK